MTEDEVKKIAREASLEGVAQAFKIIGIDIGSEHFQKTQADFILGRLKGGPQP